MDFFVTHLANETDEVRIVVLVMSAAVAFAMNNRIWSRVVYPRLCCGDPRFCSESTGFGHGESAKTERCIPEDDGQGYGSLVMGHVLV